MQLCSPQPATVALKHLCLSSATPMFKRCTLFFSKSSLYYQTAVACVYSKISRHKQNSMRYQNNHKYMFLQKALLFGIRKFVNQFAEDKRNLPLLVRSKRHRYCIFYILELLLRLLQNPAKISVNNTYALSI